MDGDDFGQEWAVQAVESGIERATDDTEREALNADRDENPEDYEEESEEDGE